MFLVIAEMAHAPADLLFGMSALLFPAALADGIVRRPAGAQGGTVPKLVPRIEEQVPLKEADIRHRNQLCFAGCVIAATIVQFFAFKIGELLHLEAHSRGSWVQLSVLVLVSTCLAVASVFVAMWILRTTPVFESVKG